MEWFHPEVAQSMFSLVKGGGFFKSIKQRNFLRSPKGFPWHVVIYDFDNNNNHSEETISFFRENFGIKDVNQNDTIYCVQGEIRWADYGAKSYRRVEHIFIGDEYGIRGQYKLHFKGDYRSGSGVDGTQTESVWKRDPSAALPVFVEPPKPEFTPGEWIGEVGKRMDVVLTVKKIIEIQGRSFSYYDSGISYLYLAEDASGNSITYMGNGNFPAEGETATVRCTVKEHSVYKDRKQTVINRPKVI